MLNIGKILLPVDFERPSVGVVHQAAALARHFHSEIIMLHVVTPLSYSAGTLEGSYVPSGRDDLLAELIRQAQKHLDQCLKPELESLTVRRVLLEGDPALEIVKVARDERVKLIVMPTHGYGAFRRFLLGSVTAKVLHDGDCPIWTGAHVEEETVGEFAIRNVLCAIDLSDHSRNTVSWAAEMAAASGARLTLAHITAELDVYSSSGPHVISGWKETIASSATQQIACAPTVINTNVRVTTAAPRLRSRIMNASQPQRRLSRRCSTTKPSVRPNVLRDSSPDHHIGKRLDHLVTPQPSCHPDRQAFPCVFLEQHQQPQRPSVMRHRAHEVVGPNLVDPLRSQPHTRPVVQPQPSPRFLFLRHLQPLPPPDALHPILAHLPARFTQLHGDPPVAIAPVFTGQCNDRFGQGIFVDPRDRGIALCPSPLPRQPTGMPLAHCVLLARMLHRTTPPLRA
jgi:nucleotide-binding universal stress UspA family protein